MPGFDPLSNTQFINSPDFNNQAVQGITGPGVFRQFSYISPGGTSLTVSSSYLWNIVELTGNGIITVPPGITANVGDEILFVNSTGLMSFTGNILSPSIYAVLPRRPARLVYAGSDLWILSSDKQVPENTTLTDCCGNVQPTAYTFGPASFAASTVYANALGTVLYNSRPRGGGAVQTTAAILTIVNGLVSGADCTTVNFDQPYTFYNSDSAPLNLYSYYADINILDDAQLDNVPFKTGSYDDQFRCSSDGVVSGTYYRATDVYGVISPVCFANGIVSVFNVCPP